MKFSTDDDDTVLMFQEWRVTSITGKPALTLIEGGVRVCGDAVLRYFRCRCAVIFILTRGIAVSKH